jgi:hypothetical protein
MRAAMCRPMAAGSSVGAAGVATVAAVEEHVRAVECGARSSSNDINFGLCGHEMF